MHSFQQVSRSVYNRIRSRGDDWLRWPLSSGGCSRNFYGVGRLDLTINNSPATCEQIDVEQLPNVKKDLGKGETGLSALDFTVSVPSVSPPPQLLPPVPPPSWLVPPVSYASSNSMLFKLSGNPPNVYFPPWSANNIAFGNVGQNASFPPVVASSPSDDVNQNENADVSNTPESWATLSANNIAFGTVGHNASFPPVVASSPSDEVNQNENADVLDTPETWATMS